VEGYRMMTVAEFSRMVSPDWDGICPDCGHDYLRNCQGNCACPGCKAQRRADEEAAYSMNFRLRST